MSAAGGAAPTAPAPPPPPPTTLRQMLLRPGYLRMLVFSTALGIPVAVACFLFVGFQHELQHWVWESLPHSLGMDRAPWWWPLPAFLLAGLILAPIVTRMPGKGGHLAVHGLGGGAPIGPRELPGVVLAALATLPLGVVLGPEAPLMAVGSGLVLLAVKLLRQSPGPQESTLLATAGSTAAISTILGGPIVAAVLVVEAAGIGGARLVALLLPCLLASAAGALAFNGFGDLTGLSIGALSLPGVPPDSGPDPGDFLWGVPVAVAIAAILTAGRQLGYRTAAFTTRDTGRRTVLCAVAAGVCVTAYALLTGRDPAEAALSGQAALGSLAADPAVWSVAALLVLVLCKTLAWGICLGSMRGGPIFPSVLIGAALGVACAGLPGLGFAPGLALGMAAAAATITGLPLSSSVLAVLLLGPDAHHQMPLVVTAAVVACVTAHLLRKDDPKDPAG
ncbi:chloride channel protein [Streptomyces sp. NPDC097619]|uniref:chloride channel protein n=1 Tax=Streptomyces sp. NPDC097619 TaxID=3157228 RepID=UPI0033199201